MIDTSLFYGTPRLRVMASDKTTILKTLFLPLPDKRDGVQFLDIPAKGMKRKLLGGGMAYKGGGVIHQLTLNYAIYDPRNTGKAIGNGNGQTPTLGALYDILTTYENGTLQVSPCANEEIWFSASSTGELARNPLSRLCWVGVSLVFEGHEVYPYSSALMPFS